MGLSAAAIKVAAGYISLQEMKPMEICDRGLLAAGDKGSARAVMIFPTVTSLSDGKVLATWRCGSKKDSEDASVEFCSSSDSGRTWSKPQTLFGTTYFNGVRGSMWCTYLTEIEPGHLLAASLWVNREIRPGAPLFNTVTEGC